MEEKKDKISLQGAVGIVTLALFFDASGAIINIIPFIGQVLSVIIGGLGYLIVGFCFFYFFQVNVLETKRLMKFFSGAIIEIIPVINILPGLTASVIMTIMAVNIAEKTGVKPTNAGAKLGKAFRKRKREKDERENEKGDKEKPNETKTAQ